MTSKLTLVSHHLCPYVQRAAISLAEKKIAFDRHYIDLADKPDWFLAISPLGKVPVLKVDRDGREVALFESAPILEYLEETQPPRLHPADPLSRAEHRAWIEFGSQVLNDIAGLYNAPDEPAFAAKADALTRRFEQLEARLSSGPYFAGSAFSLVDAVFAPVFRYFDVLDAIAPFGILTDKDRLARWRTALADRPSVRRAVTPDYPSRLWDFLAARGSHLSALMT